MAAEKARTAEEANQTTSQAVRFRQNKRIKRNAKTIRIVLLIGILALAGWGIYQMIAGDSDKATAQECSSCHGEKLPVRPVDLSEDEKVDPAVPKGVRSWHDVNDAAKKNPEVLSAICELHPEFDQQMFERLLAEESKGKTFKKSYGKGTRYVNTDYNKPGDDEYVFFWDTLEKETGFLTLTNEKPAVKMICGNAALITKGCPVDKKTTKNTSKKPPTTTSKKPPKYCTNGKGSKDPLNKSKVSQSTSSKSGKTNGYTSGSAEGAANQQRSNGGGNAPATGGHAGTGAGGTTGSGGTQTPGGGTETYVPPSNETGDSHRDDNVTSGTVGL